MHRACLVLFSTVSLALLPACVDERQACEAYAVAACETDDACGGTNPCSIECDHLEVEDEQALEACTDEVEAITIPDEVAEPLEHSFACGERYAKQLECVQLFEP